MLKIRITSDERGEGKTTLAVKLLQAMPNTMLCVRNPSQARFIIKKFDLPQSIASRVVYSGQDTRGLDDVILIDDTN